MISTSSHNGKSIFEIFNAYMTIFHAYRVPWDFDVARMYPFWDQKPCPLINGGMIARAFLRSRVACPNATSLLAPWAISKMAKTQKPP